MSVFPLFIDLKDKKCVVVGGGKVASRKIETLLQFGAEITVVSPVITDQLKVCMKNGVLKHIERNYSEIDIEGAFLAIAATADKIENEKIYLDAVNRGIFVNVVDSPEKCTFIFPSVVKRDKLVIGISTSGTFPVLAKYIRKKLEKILFWNYEVNVTEILENCRERVLLKIKDEDEKKEIMNRLLDEAVFSQEITDREQLDKKIEKIFGEY
jgi:precorrin-2 dehydrogenase / sirohydrochlorin ferrochelatase